jgi:hypothetical protein
MAGNTDNPLYMFLVRLKLNRIIAFPYRGFLMDKVLFANSSPAYDTNSHSVCIFAFSGTFITFHYFPSKSEKSCFIRIYSNICYGDLRYWSHIHLFIMRDFSLFHHSSMRVISSPQQTSVPPPTFVTVTSLPQISQRYFSPFFDTPTANSPPFCSSNFLKILIWAFPLPCYPRSRLRALELLYTLTILGI